MTDSGSYTSTYSASDVIKVADRFAADLVMLSQSTGLLESARASGIIEDIKLMAKRDYIERISVVLFNAVGDEIRARKYVVSKDASLWTSDRPGDSLWPSTPGGDLSVILHYTDTWRNLGDAAQADFQKGLQRPWGPSDVDTSFPGLSGKQSRRYASNAYGLQRTDFE